MELVEPPFKQQSSPLQDQPEHRSPNPSVDDSQLLQTRESHVEVLRRQPFRFKKNAWDEAQQSFAETYADDQHKPLFLPSMIVAYPRACFWTWCCTIFIALLATIGLFIVGSEPISFDRVSEVGLDLPYNKYFERYQAFARTPKVASYGTDTDGCRQSSIATSLNVILTRADNGNVLTKAGLEQLQSKLDYMISVGKYPQKCTLTYGTCGSDGQVKKTSPSCCVVSALNQTVAYGTGTYDATDESGCFLPKSPIFYFEKYGDPTFDNIFGTLSAIRNLSDTDYANVITLFDGNFDLDSNLKSKMLSATLFFGIPQHDWNETISDDDYEDEETESLNDWIGKKYGDYLEDEYNKSPYKLLYMWSGYNPLEDIILQDLSLVFVGIILVYIYMTFTFKSLFLSSCVMYQIFMAFFGANLIYRYLWPTDSGIGYKYFALFNGLSIFIILGIGADDSFVFNDTWTDHAKRHQDVAQRLSVVWVKAGKAMLVTSLTTVISFFSNMSSDFIGIKTFGTYAGLLVIVNYLFVITYFPSAVYYYHVYLKNTSWCPPCKTRTDIPQEDHGDSMIGKPVPADSMVDPNVLDELTETAESDDSFCGPFRRRYRQTRQAWKNFDLAIFLSETYAPWVFKYRYFIFGSFSALVLVFLVFACMLQAVPFQVYTLLPVGTNFHDYLYNLYEKFPTSAAPLYAYIVFGWDLNHPIEYGNSFHTYDYVVGESGDPVFNLSFDISDPYFQVQFYETCSWIADQEEFDYSGMKIDHTYGVNPQLNDAATSATGGQFGVQCLMDAFSRYEDVTTFHPGTQTFSAPLPSAGSWEGYELDTSCHYCFANYSLYAKPTDSQTGEYEFPDFPNFIWNTSHVIDKCNCMGVFPIPKFVCLKELEDISIDSRFTCVEQDNFAYDLGAWLTVDQDAYDWWKSFVYADSDFFGNFNRIVMTYIQVQTKLSLYDNDFESGLAMTHEWDDWVDKYNKRMREVGGQEAVVHIPQAASWVVTAGLAPNAIRNTLLSLGLAYVVLLVATTNWILASLAIFNVSMIVVTIFGFIQMTGWGLGVLESICCVLVVGFSVDFTIHLVDTYSESFEDSRFAKTREALATTGVSVISGAFSTLLATLPMLFATVIFFFRFGIFMFLTMTLSLVYSMGYLAAMLMIAGPIGHAGDLSKYYGPFITGAYHSLEEKRHRFRKESTAKRP